LVAILQRALAFKKLVDVISELVWKKQVVAEQEFASKSSADVISELVWTKSSQMLAIHRRETVS
jgi:hypothetical protein